MLMDTCEASPYCAQTMNSLGINVVIASTYDIYDYDIYYNNNDNQNENWTFPADVFYETFFNNAKTMKYIG